jgi:hypothetical protein
MLELSGSWREDVGGAGKRSRWCEMLVERCLSRKGLDLRSDLRCDSTDGVRLRGAMRSAEH